jgi:hypothetical protein
MVVVKGAKSRWQGTSPGHIVSVCALRRLKDALIVLVMGSNAINKVIMQNMRCFCDSKIQNENRPRFFYTRAPFNYVAKHGQRR